MSAQYWAQIRAIVRLEMKKTFFARRGLWVYLLALAPIVLFAGHSIDMLRDRARRQMTAAQHPVSREALESFTHGMTGLTRQDVRKVLGEPAWHVEQRRRSGLREFDWYTDGESEYRFQFQDGELVGIHRRQYCSFGEDSMIFAGVFQFFYLRLAIFFGCVGIFMNLFRGELLDKSLHYYLLAPVRREVLLVGKYLAGLIATVVIFTTSTAVQLVAMAWHFPSNVIQEYLLGPGWGHVGAYLGVTALACLGYGSVFLAAGLLFRNPIIPAAAVLLWEGINWFLPAALKKISVIFYLQSLSPIVADAGRDLPPPLRLLIATAEPTPAPLAVTGLVLVTLAVLVMAGRQVRKLEIDYGAE